MGPDSAKPIDNAPAADDAADSFVVPVHVERKQVPVVTTRAMDTGFVSPDQGPAKLEFSGPGAAAAGSVNDPPPEVPATPTVSSPVLDTPFNGALQQPSSPDAINQGSLLEEAPVNGPSYETPPEPEKPFYKRRAMAVGLLAFGVLMAAVLGLRIEVNKSKVQNSSLTTPSSKLQQQQIPLTTLNQQLGVTSSVSTAGVTVNGSLVLAPSVQPGNPVAGQLFYSQTANQLQYYDGTGYVGLQGGGNITNNITNVYNSTATGGNTFVTNNIGTTLTGTPGTLAMFGTGGSTLADSLISQNGTTVTTSAQTLQGSASQGLSILTANTSGASGALVLESGNSATASSGAVTLDSGSGVVNGTVADNYTFEDGIDGFDNTPFGGTVAQSNVFAHSGTYSLGLTLANSSWSSAAVHDLTVIPGHEYRLTAWVRAGTSPSPVNMDVYFRSLNTNGPTASTTDSVGSWTELTDTFVNPNGDTLLDPSFVYEKNTTSGEIHYIDDVVLTDLNTFTGLSVNVGTTNAQAITIGNTNQAGDTTITGGTTGVKINDAVGNVHTTGTSVILGGDGATGDGVIVEPQANSLTAFQVQNSSGNSLLAVDTINSAVILGSGGAAPNVPILQGAAAVGNNIIGANMTIAAGNGTGVGGSGDIVFDTAGGLSNPQVTMDTTLGDNYTVTNGPVTFTYTTGSESDRLLIVTVDSAAVSNPSVASSVTYGGQALTELTGLVAGEANGSVWYLVNPASGPNAISVTMTGTPSDVGVEGATFYNVDQSNPIANFATGQSHFASTTSTTLTGTNTGEGIFDSVMARADWGNNLTFGTGQQIVYDLGYYSNHSTGSFRQGEADATTMSESNQAYSDLNHVVMAINPEPNVNPDTLSETFRVTQNKTLGVDLTSGESAPNTISFGGSADRTIGVNQNPGTGAGHNLTVSAGGGAAGSNNGGNLILQGGQATGSGISGAVTMQTENSANTTGGVSVLTGNSSTTSAGNITVDTGTSIVSGTTIDNNTFEASTEAYGSHNGGVAQSTAEAHSGSDSLAFTQGVGGSWDVYDQNPFSVTPGHTYNITAWVRAGANPETISSAMVWVGPGTYTSLANVNESSSAWTEISGTVTAPAGATAAYPDFAGTWENPGFVHYFDDITVIDMSSSSAQALVSIGGTNAQAVILGNANEIGATNIFGGSGINLNSGVGNITLTSGGTIVRAEADSTTTFQIQNTSNTSLFTADTTNMNITIGGALVVTGNITVDGHVVTGGSTPGVAAGAAACTSPPTPTITGTDTSGTITVTTGGSGCVSGIIANITFANAFGATPHITLTPNNASTQTLGQYVNGGATSANGFSIGTANTPSISTAYSWNYWVAQ